MTDFVLLSLATATGVLYVLMISSVTTETHLTSVYHMHVPRRIRCRSRLRNNCAFQHCLKFILLRYTRILRSAYKSGALRRSSNRKTMLKCSTWPPFTAMIQANRFQNFLISGKARIFLFYALHLRKALILRRAGKTYKFWGKVFGF